MAENKISPRADTCRTYALPTVVPASCPSSRQLAERIHALVRWDLVRPPNPREPVRAGYLPYAASGGACECLQAPLYSASRGLASYARWRRTPLVCLQAHGAVIRARPDNSARKYWWCFHSDLAPDVTYLVLSYRRPQSPRRAISSALSTNACVVSTLRTDGCYGPERLRVGTSFGVPPA